MCLTSGVENEKNRILEENEEPRIYSCRDGIYGDAAYKLLWQRSVLRSLPKTTLLS